MEEERGGDTIFGSDWRELRRRLSKTGEGVRGAGERAPSETAVEIGRSACGEAFAYEKD